MILVLLGTQDKEFPRLLQAIDREIEQGNIHEKVIVQAGQTKYTSKNMEIFDFLSEPEFEKLMDEADLIITHGGAGSILSAIKKGKKVIAAARLAKYHEHHNDHQKQIISEFASQGYILELKDFNRIGNLIEKSKKFKPKKFESNTHNMVKLIENYIENTNHISWFNRNYTTISFSIVSSICFMSLFFLLFHGFSKNFLFSLYLSIGIIIPFMIFLGYKKFSILQLVIYMFITIGFLVWICYLKLSVFVTIILSMMIPILGNCVVRRIVFSKN